MAPLAVRGLEYVIDMRIECARKKEFEREAVAIVKSLSSTVIPCERMRFV